MFLGTSGGKSTGDSEDDGFFAGGKGRDRRGLEFTIGIEVGECCVRKLISDGDSGGDLGCFGGKGNGF